jgi:hypothetical protein
MPFSTKKIAQIRATVEQHGIDEAAFMLGLRTSSVERAMRGRGKTIVPNVDTRPEHLPKVLVFDIETSPILARVWSIWQQNVGLNQIKEDWFVLSWAAKWLGVDGVMYQDLRGIIDDGDKYHQDKPILAGIWNLLNDADIVITQNGKKFDQKKLNSRFILNGFQPPSHFKHIDTLQIAKSVFGFTSNKLEYLTDKLCTKYKKQVHRDFSGFELWKECLADNPDAWDCMEKYNKYDVLSLEELYYILAPWDRKHPNFALLTGSETPVCRCGSTEFTRNGYAYTQVSKFQKYRCKKCGAETRGRTNVLDKDVRSALHMNISQ